jgi:hypothetical protein
MSNISSWQSVPTLQKYYWPPVNAFERLDEEVSEFLQMRPHEQRCSLLELRTSKERHGNFLHDTLSLIYSYVLGYRDSPCFEEINENFERQLMSAKLTLETELIETEPLFKPIPQNLSQKAAKEYLNDLASNNLGLTHPLFAFLESASKETLIRFLQHEVMRNEVVDDEVSLLISGLQGHFKRVVVNNLWDECGRGVLHKAHTYWLRRLLEATDGWHELPSYRRQSPWFSKIVSNAFMMLLTRPAYKLSAYGYFLVSESSVASHFEKILAGLEKVGLIEEDVTVYFEAHLKIDRHHGEQLVDVVSHQEPCLTRMQVDRLLWGAHFHVTESIKQFDQMLAYLLSTQ